MIVFFSRGPKQMEVAQFHLLFPWFFAGNLSLLEICVFSREVERSPPQQTRSSEGFAVLSRPQLVYFPAFQKEMWVCRFSRVPFFGGSKGKPRCQKPQCMLGGPPKKEEPPHFFHVPHRMRVNMAVGPIFHGHWQRNARRFL